MSPFGKRLLRFLGWFVGVIIGALILIGAYVQMRWDAKDDRLAPELKAPADSGTIARGEYIFKFQAQCWGCHAAAGGDATTPPSGGRLFDLSHTGPGFGKWYSRNLTPDVETGLGGWTDGEIVQALREGVRKDRTMLFPIMPADWYHGMSDDDALAVVAYLRSIPPVKNEVPRSEPSFVAKALLTFKVIKPKQSITTPITAPPRGITVEYGRYLSNNLAGCADCHTPRNLRDGEFYLDSLFAGGSFPIGGIITAYARNITPDLKTGIGAWTEVQFLDAVTGGFCPDSTVLIPQMPYAYYKSWSSDDLKAVFTYIKTVAARVRSVPPPKPGHELNSAQGVDQGRLIFRSRCQSCHGKDGSGAQPTNVKLAEVTGSLSDAELQEFISGGQLNLKMPAYGKTLSSSEMTNLVAFIRTWGKGN